MAERRFFLCFFCFFFFFACSIIKNPKSSSCVIFMSDQMSEPKEMKMGIFRGGRPVYHHHHHYYWLHVYEWDGKISHYFFISFYKHKIALRRCLRSLTCGRPSTISSISRVHMNILPPRWWFLQTFLLTHSLPHFIIIKLWRLPAESHFICTTISYKWTCETI